MSFNWEEMNSDPYPDGLGTSFSLSFSSSHSLSFSFSFSFSLSLSFFLCPLSLPFCMCLHVSMFAFYSVLSLFHHLLSFFCFSISLSLSLSLSTIWLCSFVCITYFSRLVLYCRLAFNLNYSQLFMSVEMASPVTESGKSKSSLRMQGGKRKTRQVLKQLHFLSLSLLPLARIIRFCRCTLATFWVCDVGYTSGVKLEYF